MSLLKFYNSIIIKVSLIALVCALVQFRINEAAGATDLLAKDFNKTIDADAKTLIMFYAPWCPHCQDAKPKYHKAADALASDGDKKLALLDCDDKQNTELCTKLNIEGYPTFKLYQKGKFVADYEGDASEGAIKPFMNDPKAHSGQSQGASGGQQGGQEGGQGNEPDTPMKNVQYTNGANFNSLISPKEHALVFFYAPWCPHCVESKPKYEAAAAQLLSKTNIVLAAMNCDANENKQFCQTEKVEGFPTLRYYHKGEMFAEYEDEVDTNSIIKYLGNPPKTKQAPTPLDTGADQKGQDQQGQDQQGQDQQGGQHDLKEGEKELKDEDRKPETQAEKMQGVEYLNTETFKTFISKPKQHTLVMFYAPWCPHCTEAKPKFQAASEKLKQSKSGSTLAAVNCDEKTSEKVCEDLKIEGFPTLIHFADGKKVSDYAEQPPTTEGVVKYMSSLSAGKSKDEL